MEDEVNEVLLLLKNVFDKKNIRAERYKQGIRLELVSGDFAGITDRSYLRTAQKFLNKRGEVFEITFDLENDSPLEYVDGKENSSVEDVQVGYLYGKSVSEIKNKVLDMLKSKEKKVLKKFENLPKDFRWEKLKIILLDEHRLSFKYEDTFWGERDFSDLGIGNSKKGGVKNLFRLFFISKQADLPENDLLSSTEGKNQGNKKNLKKILCEFFETDIDPISINKESAKHDYVPKFETYLGGDFKETRFYSGKKTE
jgi:hypothetical protein